MAENSWNGYENHCLFLQEGPLPGRAGGETRFVEAARSLGTDGLYDGRGVAVADFDGDGRPDLAVSHNAAPPTLYLNRSGTPGMMIHLVGTGGAPDAVGARVRLTFENTATAAPRTLTRWVEAGSGYAAQGDFPVHFGLGTAPTVIGLEVRWPGGTVQRWPGEQLPSPTAGPWRCVEGDPVVSLVD